MVCTHPQPDDLNLQRRSLLDNARRVPLLDVLGLVPGLLGLADRALVLLHEQHGTLRDHAG